MSCSANLHLNSVLFSVIFFSFNLKGKVILDVVQTLEALQPCGHSPVGRSIMQPYSPSSLRSRLQTLCAQERPVSGHPARSLTGVVPAVNSGLPNGLLTLDRPAQA